MNTILAKEVRAMRKRAAISQNKLAKEANVSVAFISKLEAGHYKTLSIDACKQIAKALGLTLKDFLTNVGLMENGHAPDTLQVIKHALRSSGLSLSESMKVVEYADFVIKKHEANNRIAN